MVAGRLFVGERVYFALYPEVASLHMGVPPSVEDNFTRCASIQFQSRNKNARKDRTIGIDLFLLKDNSDLQYVLPRLDDAFKTRHEIRNLRVEDNAALIEAFDLAYPLNKIEADITYGIQYKIQQRFASLADKIRDVVRADILKFSKYRKVNLVRDKNPTSVQLLEEILEPPIMKKLDPAKIKLGTKSQVHPFCIQDLTIDYTRGCKSYEENGVFNIELGCTYCYNRWVNRHHFSHGYHPADKKSLAEQIKGFKIGKKIRALRIGSGTECFNPELIAEAMTTIEAANEEGIPVILPTKTPFFDKEIAEFLKHHRVNLMISLGLDELELGVCRQGFNNKERIELAKRYNEYSSEGFKVVLYPLTDLTTHPEEQKFWSTREAYRLNQEQGFPLQFLIFRTNKAALLRQITDQPIIEKNHAENGMLVPIPDNGFYLPRKEENSFYIPLHYHQFFLDVVEKGKKHYPSIGICSIVSTYSACGACLVPGLDRRKGIQKKKPLPNIEHIKEEKKKRADKVRQKHFEEKHTFQKKLFEK